MEPPAAAPTAAAHAQLDERQHDDEIMPPTHPHQVGGHAGLTNEGGALLVAEPGRLAKPVGHGYFAGEDAFYEQLRPDDALAPFVPAFFGTRCIRGRTCVVLEDVTHGMRAPCIVDIKIGTSTVAPDAGWEKRLSHLRKDRATTTRPLGLRLIGAQTVGAAGGAPFERRGKPWGKALRPQEVAAALRSCFSVGGVLRAAAVAHFVGRLQRLLHGLETAPSRQLLGSSILCVYDGAEDGAASPPPALRVIDFAHAYPLRATRDHGYCYGLRHLIRLLRGLLPPDAEVGEVGGGCDDDGEAEEGALSPRAGPLEEDGRAMLHADEFAEGAAHSNLGRWLPEWAGFDAIEDDGGRVRKRLRLRPAGAGYRAPRLLWLRVPLEADLRERAGALRAAFAPFLAEAAEQRRAAAVLRALSDELGGLAAAMREGCTFQFGGAALCFAYDAAADAARPPTVRARRVEGACMTRDPAFDPALLAAVDALHAAVLALDFS